MKSFWRNSFVWLLTCFVASFLLLAYPIYVIRPFRHQGATELSLALQVMRFRPATAVALALLAAILAFVTWKRVSRLLPRLGVVLLAVLTAISGALSFVNVYELMFHPLRRPIFKDASRTELADAEQVIAVKLARAARAYPVRIISYHHIVNDVLAGFPIVATY
jgi:thiol:disulfide interchange protein